MLGHLLAVLGLGLACGLWVLFQRWIARRDPGQPGVEGSVRGAACGVEGGCAGCGRREGCDDEARGT